MYLWGPFRLTKTIWKCLSKIKIFLIQIGVKMIQKRSKFPLKIQNSSYFQSLSVQATALMLPKNAVARWTSMQLGNHVDIQNECPAVKVGTAPARCCFCPSVHSEPSKFHLSVRPSALDGRTRVLNGRTDGQFQSVFDKFSETSTQLEFFSSKICSLSLTCWSLPIFEKKNKKFGE